jgi:hypothetical protein
VGRRFILFLPSDKVILYVGSKSMKLATVMKKIEVSLFIVIFVFGIDGGLAHLFFHGVVDEHSDEHRNN